MEHDSKYTEKFLIDLRHNLRNPLATVVILLDILKTQLQDKSDQSVKATLDDITKAVQKLSKTIDTTVEKWRAPRQ